MIWGQMYQISCGDLYQIGKKLKICVVHIKFKAAFAQEKEENETKA